MFMNDDGSGLVGGKMPSGSPDGQALQLDSSGNLKVTSSVSSSNASIGVDGSAAPASSTQIGGSDGTNLQPLQVDGSKNLKTVDANSAAILADVAKIPAQGQSTMSASTPVAIASDQTPLVSGTATRSNVVAANSDTALLASNTSRKGALFYNDSTAILYLAYGSGAASTTSYTVQVGANSFFEMPPAPVFTGAIRGIWSAANGNVRITELS